MQASQVGRGSCTTIWKWFSAPIFAVDPRLRRPTMGCKEGRLPSSTQPVVEVRGRQRRNYKPVRGPPPHFSRAAAAPLAAGRAIVWGSPGQQGMIQCRAAVSWLACMCLAGAKLWHASCGEGWAGLGTRCQPLASLHPSRVRVRACVCV